MPGDLDFFEQAWWVYLWASANAPTSMTTTLYPLPTPDPPHTMT